MRDEGMRGSTTEELRIRLRRSLERCPRRALTRYDRHAHHRENRSVARARAFAASSSRLLGGALVSSEARSLRETAAISSTAARNAASLVLDGLLKPVTMRTNCSEAERI